MLFTTDDGVALFYDERIGGDPPVLLVHGWCCDHTYLMPQREHLQGRHRVISVDLRGHGQSAKPTQAYTMPAFAKDLAGLCADLGLVKPVVIGHSMGGVVALALAARYPDLPGAIIMLDSPVLLPEAAITRMAPLVEQFRAPGYLEVVRGFVGNMFLPTDDAARKAAIVDSMSATPQHVLVSAMEGMLDHDTAADAAACRVPALAVASHSLPGDMARFRKLCPGLVTGQTVGSGHFHQLEVPEQVNAMIDRFLMTRDA